MICLAFATGCPPKYPKCSNDKDCHEKEYCVNGQCQQCRSDGDCPSGKCNAGRCAETPPPSIALQRRHRSARPDSRASTASASRAARDEQCGEGGKCNAGRCQRARGGNRAAAGQRRSCTLEPVYFDFNESVLSTEATAAIDRNAECIKKTNHAGRR